MADAPGFSPTSDTDTQLKAAVEELRELVDRSGDANELLKGIHQIGQQQILLLKDLARKPTKDKGKIEKSDKSGDGASEPGRGRSPLDGGSRGGARGTFRKLFGFSRAGRQVGRAIGSRIGRSAVGKHEWAKGKELKAARTSGAARGARIGSGVGGSAGAAVAVVAAVALALKAFHDAILKATEGAVAAAKHYSQVSGSMAAVFANREVKEIIRDMQKGEAQAGSARVLVESEQRRKDASAPIENAMSNATNRVLAGLNDTLVPILNGVNTVIEGLKELPVVGKGIKKFLEGQGANGVPLQDDINQIARSVDAMEARPKSLLDIARERSRIGIGTAVPQGAAIHRPRV